MPRRTGGDPLTSPPVNTCAMERLEAVARLRQFLAGSCCGPFDGAKR